MSFSHGSKQKLFLNGVDVSKFLRSISVTHAADTAETSTLGTTDKSYIPGMLESRLSAQGYFDGSLKAADEIFNSLLGDVTQDPLTPFAAGGSHGATFTHCPQGDSAGLVAYGFQGFAATYNPSTDIGSVAAIALDSIGNTGFERLFIFHPLGGESVAGESAVIDFGVPSGANINARAFIHWQDLPANDITLQWQQSSDNVTFSNLGSPIALNHLTPGAQRIVYSGAILRYIKLTWAAPGANSLLFHAALGRDL